MEALGGAVPYRVFERKERNGTRVTSKHILEPFSVRSFERNEFSVIHVLV